MIRFDDNTFMKLKEIAKTTGNNYSVLKLDGQKKARMDTVSGSSK